MNHERRVKKEGFYNCIYTEFISDEFNDCIVLERAYQRRHLRPIRTKEIVYTDYYDMVSRLFYLFIKIVKLKKYTLLKNELEKKIAKSICILEKKYSMNISRNDIYDIVIKEYCAYRVKKYYFKKIIMIVKPKIIFEVVSYNDDCKIVNEIANDLGIKTFELQHGVHNEEYVSYNYKSDKLIAQFPKYICTFGKYWNNAARYPTNSTAIEVGNYYLEKRYCECNDADVENQILFISSGGGLGRKIYQIALELLGLDLQVRIIYKLHPGEYNSWKDEYPELVSCDRVDIIDTLDNDIYDCLFECKAVVGAGSTSLFECSMYGAPIFIVDDIASYCSYPLIENGYAKRLVSAEELINIPVKKYMMDIDNNIFYSRGAKNNIAKIISDELGR